MGEKTKLLWQNPEYREHMKKVHVGHPKAKGAYSFPKGLKMDNDWIEKNRQSKIGKKNGMFGKKPWNYKGGFPKCLDCGKKLSTYKASRCRKCASLFLAGKHRKGWKEETRRYIHTRDKKYLQWRSDVFTKNNWTCQTCGIRGCYLEAHHIKSWAKFPEERYNIDNGVTLCKDCHKLTDNYKNG